MERTDGVPTSGEAPLTRQKRVLGLLSTTAEACRRLERPELAARLDAARARLDRGQAVVCVVGEFKHGKSALVNALLDRPVCPVDDTGTTAVPTWVHPADRAFGLIRRPAGDGVAVEETTPERAARAALSEAEPLGLIEIGIAEELPSGALGFVDTPGVGGLQPGKRAAALSFLQHADAFILTTDALGELSEPELEFLTEAHGRCPRGIVALTKIDIAPEWRRIADLDRSLLSARDVPLPVVPVSPALWWASRRYPDDPGLAAESGLPALRSLLQGGAADGAARLAAQRALADVAVVTDLLAAELGADHRATTDPAIAAAWVNELDTATERLTSLRSRGARWSTTLQDRITDLAARADAELRDGVRAILRSLDERLENADPADEWAALTDEVQAGIAGLGTRIAEEIADASVEIGAEIARMIDDDAPDVGIRAPTDVTVEWEAGDRILTQDASRFSGIFTVVRGGSSGIITLGVVGGLAGLAMAAPMSIAAGLAFGVRQYVEDRKRTVDRRRREARVAVQQHLRVAQTELASEHRRLLQEAHRALRDHFSGRIVELDAGYRHAIETARSAEQRDAAAREARLAHLDSWISAVDQLGARARSCAAELDEGSGS